MIKKIIMGLLALVVIGVAFFFLYVAKTPYYSLYLVHKAVESHDTVAFEQHVDLDNIFSKGIDDLIASGMKGKKSIGIDPVTATIIKLVKPTVAHALKDNVLDSVKKEKAQPAQTQNGQAAQKEIDKPKKKNKLEANIPLLNKLKERLDVSNLRIKDSNVTKKDDATANVAIVLRDIKLDKDFNVDLRMTKLDNGEWQIKEITNFVAFLTEVEQATKQAAKESMDESAKENKTQQKK